MSALEIYPSTQDMEIYYSRAKDYMHPNRIPFAVSAEGYLTEEECDAISAAAVDFDGYRHPGCNALTKEIGYIPQLAPVQYFAEATNDIYWQYEMDDTTVSWLQTYGVGDSYDLHADGDPARMRKLTAVVMLTDPIDYAGGELTIHWWPASWEMPKTQGTIICFQPWIFHEVEEVTRGFRETINMSFWGPNFK